MSKTNTSMCIVVLFTITCSILLLGCSRITQLIDTGKKKFRNKQKLT